MTIDLSRKSLIFKKEGLNMGALLFVYHSNAPAATSFEIFGSIVMIVLAISFIIWTSR